MSLQSRLKKLFTAEYYSTKFAHEDHAQVKLHVPIRAKQISPYPESDSRDFELEQKILDKVSSPSGQISTLILGDSGTGKSWLALKCTQGLYDALDFSQNPFDPQDSTLGFPLKIPLYIPLRAIEKFQDKNCLGSRGILYSFLKRHSPYFKSETGKDRVDETYASLCSRSVQLILFLDGYDELKNKRNLWKDNEWDSVDSNVQTFIFCRTSSFLNEAKSDLFCFAKGGHRTAFQYEILQLDKNMVSTYIGIVPRFLKGIDPEKYSVINDPWMMTKDTCDKYPGSSWYTTEYRFWFDKLPELIELSQNVFVLTTICQVLPSLVERLREKYADEPEQENNGDQVTRDEQERRRRIEIEESLKRQICETEVSVYDAFTTAWVDYQVDRIVSGRENADLCKISEDLGHYIFAYAQNLAIHYINCNSRFFGNETILDGSISTMSTEFWNLWVPWDPKEPDSKGHYDFKGTKFQRNAELEKTLFPQSDQDKDEGRFRNLCALRDASLLRCNRKDKTFAFLHLSLLEYFASRDIFENLRGHLNFYINNTRGEEPYFLINQNRIQDYPGILANVVDKSKTNENFQKVLVDAVKKSAEVPEISRMASNAMTILNLCGYNFSGNHQDFRHIQVPEANLSKAICGNSDFTGANFKGANFTEGWFQNCRFQGANFAKCHFGQHRPVELEQGIFVHDMLCYYKAEIGSSEGVYHVFLCGTLNNNDMKSLYCYTFEYSTNFRLIESNQIFVLETQLWNDDQMHLVNKGKSVYLLILTNTSLDEKTVLVPKTLYELNFSSIVNTIDINFKVSQLNFPSNHSKSLHKRYIIIEKAPQFATENEFFENYTQQKLPCFIANSRLPVHLTLFSWLPVGSLKLLICTHFQLSRNVDITDIFQCVMDISVLQGGLPTLVEGEVESFEVWWFQRNLIQLGYNTWLERIVFDGNSTLSLSIAALIETEVHDKNVFYFDLHMSKIIPYTKAKNLGQNSRSKRLVYSRQKVAIWVQDEVTLEFKLTDAEYKFSAELDYVAQRKHDSIKIINTVTGRVEKVVFTDVPRPFAFVTTLSNTSFAYIYKTALNFIQLSNTSSKLSFLSDAKLRKSLNSRVVAFRGLMLSNNMSLPDVISTHSAFVVREIMVVKDKIIICKADYGREGKRCSLIAFAPDGKQVNLIGVPNYNRFHAWELYLLKWKEQILVETLSILSAYKLQETNKSVSENQHFDFELELVKLSSTGSCSLGLQVSYLTSVSTAPNGSYLISEHSPGKPKSVFYWDTMADSITELSVKDPVKFSEMANETQIPCFFYYGNNIYVGNVDLEQQHFFVTNFVEVNSAGHRRIYEKALSNPRWSPIIQLSPTLSWLSILTAEGEIVILDSDSLQPMFSFQGLNRGVELYVEEISDTIGRMIIWSLHGHVTWLKINAKSLRKCFECQKLDEFKDWSVEKTDSTSTRLSLYQTDIADLRGIDKSSLDFLKYFGSKGDPSDKVYVPFCSLFEPVTDSVESMLCMTGHGFGGPVDLTEKWTVTVIAKKSKVLRRATVDWHSGLVLEGIHYNRHFVIRAHLVLKKKVGSVGVLKGNSETHKVNVWSLGAGNKSGYLDIVDNYVASQYEVSKEGGMKLLENIWSDTRQKWSYSLWKNNCNTWCKQKLALIGYKIPKRKMLKKFPDISKDFFEKHNLKDQLGRTKKN